MNGQWNCHGLILNAFQNGCMVTTTDKDIVFTVSGSTVTFTGKQFQGVVATVNPLQTEITSSSEFLCKKETGK